MKKGKYKIIISGGGTGGHVYPAIAIANELKKHNTEILFVGAEKKLEMKKVPQAGFKIIGLPIQGFQRRLTYKNIIGIFKLLKSIFKSRKILKNFEPNLVIGVGGYASAPILYMASNRKIPTLIQEQNSYPGITNKYLSKKAKKICVAFHNMDRYFPKEKIVFTGNPIRNDLLNLENKRYDAYKYFDLKESKKTLLILGGSLGARTINQSIITKLQEIKAKEEVQILWQTGKYYINQVSKLVNQADYSNIKFMAFIEKMDYAYAIADLIISRAGAGTISELCVVGKPCILVPSPNVVEDHQTKNVISLVEKNAAMMVKDSEAVENLLPLGFSLISDKEKLSALEENIKPLGMKNAAENIVKEVFKILENEF